MKAERFGSLPKNDQDAKRAKVSRAKDSQGRFIKGAPAAPVAHIEAAPIEAPHIEAAPIEQAAPVAAPVAVPAAGALDPVAAAVLGEIPDRPKAKATPAPVAEPTPNAEQTGATVRNPARGLLLLLGGAALGGLALLASNRRPAAPTNTTPTPTAPAAPAAPTRPAGLVVQ